MTEDELRDIAANYILDYGRRQMDDYTIALNFGHVVSKQQRERYITRVRYLIRNAEVTIKIDNVEVVR